MMKVLGKGSKHHYRGPFFIDDKKINYSNYVSREHHMNLFGW